MSENDPKYEHWTERHGVAKPMAMPDFTPAAEKTGKGKESSEVGQLDFFRGASERDCDDSAWEAQSRPEIEQRGEGSMDERRARAREKKENE